MDTTFTPPSLLRTALTLVFSVIAAFGMYNLGNNPPIMIYALSGLLVLAPFAARRRSLAMQIGSRAIWLQVGILGLLATIDLSQGKGIALLIGGAGALLVAGFKGMDAKSALFTPTAFRKTLLASLVFGLADFCALTFYFGIYSEEYLGRTYMAGGGYLTIGALFVSVIAMAISLRGLFKMKMWGLVACVLSNIGVASLALTGVFDLPDILVAGLVTTAAIQMLLPVPIVARIVKVTKLAA